MKKFLCHLLVLLLLAAALTGCGADTDTINVVSREDGSGTRSSFTEIFSLEEKDESGKIVDITYERAEITNNTAVVMTSISGDENAIGYISLGSLNNSVKAVSVSGVYPTSETIKNGSYKASRSFFIATKDDITDVASDFISYALSSDGQGIVEQNGYVSVGTEDSYQSSDISGKIVISGSSSVSPMMEALSEAYMKVNPGVDIEIQQSDSTTGINSLSEGICDIAMSSRALKESEIQNGAIPSVIALDGIAVIVNNNNTLDNLTFEEISEIFSGKIREWSQLIE